MTPQPTDAPPRRIEYVRLAKIQPALRNAKNHDREGIKESIRRLGFGAPGVVDDRTGRLVAGHGRFAALIGMHSAGEPAPDGILVDEHGDWAAPVVHGWSSTSDAHAEAMLLADNRHAERGGWLAPELAEMVEGLAAEADELLAAAGFSTAELDQLLADLNPPEPDPEPAVPDPDVVDRAPLPEDDTRPIHTHEGDVWQLGPHRLVCGDAFNPADVTLLLDGRETVDCVVQDPPYAIYGSSTGMASDVADDSMVRPFFTELFRVVRGLVPWFAHIYTFTDWRSYATLWHGMNAAGLTPKNALIWDKGGSGLGSNYANTYEMIAFAHKLPPRGAMAGSIISGIRSVNRSNVIRANRPTGTEREHNAAKPVGLLVELIRNSTAAGETVLDLFAGSGSTLIAADQTGRVCYAMEKDARRCDTIARRYQRVTDQLAHRNGEPVDLLAE